MHDEKTVLQQIGTSSMLSGDTLDLDLERHPLLTPGRV